MSAPIFLTVYFEGYSEISPEAVERLRKVTGAEVETEVRGDQMMLKYGFTEHVLTLEDALSVGHPFRVNPTSDNSRAVNYTNKKIAEFVASMPSKAAAPAPVNERCNVMVAGTGGLMHIDLVTVREDSCTDALQQDINEGWRILAICVQPNQRRPDYVLGKIKSEK